MDTTLPDDVSMQPSGEEPRVWSLVLVHHPDRSWHGRRFLIPRGTTCRLGRGGDHFGVGALEEHRISREHIELSMAAGLLLRDLGSRNGTTVNGEDVEQRDLADGDVIGIGQCLLVVRHAAMNVDGPVTWSDPPVGVSPAFQRSLKRIERLADHRTCLLIVGESGAGCTTLARWFHQSVAPDTPLRTVSCSALGRATLLKELLGERAAPAAAVGAESNAMVLLEGVDETPVSAQPAVIALLDQLTEQSPRPYVVATSNVSPGEGGQWGTELSSRVARWVVGVPGLQERPEDVALLADAFVQRFAGPEPRLDKRFAIDLIRRNWPGQVRELEAHVESAVIEADKGEKIRAPQPGSESTSSGEWVVDRDGGWFEPPGQQRVELTTRPSLRGMLSMLIATRARHPGRSLSVQDLLQAGWPGEKPSEESGANRVYVALTTLRRLGLKDVLTRTKTGYLLAQDAPLRLE